MAPFKHLVLRSGHAPSEFRMAVCPGMAGCELEAAARARYGAAPSAQLRFALPDGAVVPLSAALPDGTVLQCTVVPRGKGASSPASGPAAGDEQLLGVVSDGLYAAMPPDPATRRSPPGCECAYEVEGPHWLLGSVLRNDLANERTLLSWLRTALAGLRTALAFLGYQAVSPHGRDSSAALVCGLAGASALLLCLGWSRYSATRSWHKTQSPTGSLWRLGIGPAIGMFVVVGGAAAVEAIVGAQGTL